MTRVQSRSGRTDQELLAVAREQPDSDAGRAGASELLERYEARVYHWCFRYVRDHDRALDLAQDVLIKAYRGLVSFRGASQFSSWLFAIARHRCLNAVRPVSLLRDEDADLDLVPDDATLPDEALEREQGEARLMGLIDRCLDETEKRALWLRTSERLPVDEITRLLGIDQRSGARGVLQTARRKLQAELARRGGHEREP